MSEFENTARDDAPGPGAIISYAREQLGISVEDLATELKLSQHKLRLIENNQFEQVGTPTFVRGYLRNASRVLQLDIAVLLEEYDAYQGHEKVNSVESQEPEIVKSNRSSNKLLWLLPLMLAIILSVWFFATSSPQPENAGDTEPSSAEVKAGSVKPELTKDLAQERSQEDSLQTVLPAEERHEAKDSDEDKGEGSLKLDDDASSAPPALGMSEEKNAQEIAKLNPEKTDLLAETSAGLNANTPAKAFQSSVAHQVSVNTLGEPSQVLAEGEKQLIFDFNDSCWLQVRDATGKRLYSNTKAAGQQLRLKGVAPFRVNIGNVRAVSLTVDGEAYPLQARAGRKTLALTIL